jgi:hypothetical protein
MTPNGMARPAGTVLTLLFVTPTWAASPAQTVETDCLEILRAGTGPEIACDFPMVLSAEERAELESGSRGYVKDVRCKLSLKIARAAVTEAISARDHVFQSPDQPVTCTVTTPKSSFDITATFAPRVVIKNDVAVEATPGLGNVAGITRAISWPVVVFVNRWPSIRTGMLQVVNAYRAHVRKTAAQAVGPNKNGDR